MPDETQQAAQVAETTNEAQAQAAQGEAFDLPRAMTLIEKLRGEIKELKPKAKQAEELAQAQKQREEAEMTEVQKLSKRLAETETALKAERRAAQAAGIAAKFGLPAPLAERLKGETPEEMEADAKALLEALPKPQAQEPAKPKTPGPVNPGSNGKAEESAADRNARLNGPPADIWAPRQDGVKWNY